MGTLASSLDLSSDPIYLRKPCRDPPGGAFSFFNPAQEGTIDARTLRQGHGYEEKGEVAEEESDCDEKDFSPQESTPGLMASSVKAAFVASHRPKKRKLGSGRSVKVTKKPSNLGRGK
jgi:hypothetical protein